MLSMGSNTTTLDFQKSLILTWFLAIPFECLAIAHGVSLPEYMFVIMSPIKT